MEVWRTGSMDTRHRWRRVRKRGLASLQATFGMVIAGTTLVPATPPRPGQHPANGRRSGPDQPCKEMAHLGNAQGKQKMSSKKGRPGGRRRRSGATGACTNPCKVGKSQHDECDVPVPTDEAAHLVVIQSHVFGVFPHPLRHASVRQWPSPSLAGWFPVGRTRNRSASLADQRDCGG